MTGKAVQMMYVSKVPTLLGQKQAKENRFIGQAELIKETGLTRATIAAWLDPKKGFKNLNADVAHAFATYFDAKLDEIVELVRDNSAA